MIRAFIVGAFVVAATALGAAIASANVYHENCTAARTQA
jgi:hypothetical protein